MRGTTSKLTPLAARKRLLLMESEINRVELRRECLALGAEASGLVGQLTGQMRTLGSIASAGAVVLTLGSVVRRLFSKNHAAKTSKTSLTHKLLNGARAGISVWTALRSRAR